MWNMPRALKKTTSKKTTQTVLSCYAFCPSKKILFSQKLLVFVKETKQMTEVYPINSFNHNLFSVFVVPDGAACN